MNFSSPECVTWLTLGVTESAVVLAGNLITIIVFMKNNYLRKRRLYLVMNLTVPDILAAGIFTAQIIFSLDSHCKFSKFNLGSYRSAVPLYFAIYFLIYLFSSDIADKHCYDFSTASTRHFSPIQASRH